MPHPSTARQDVAERRDQQAPNRRSLISTVPEFGSSGTGSISFRGETGTLTREGDILGEDKKPLKERVSTITLPKTPSPFVDLGDLDAAETFQAEGAIDAKNDVVTEINNKLRGFRLKGRQLRNQQQQFNDAATTRIKQAEKMLRRARSLEGNTGDNRRQAEAAHLRKSANELADEAAQFEDQASGTIQNNLRQLSQQVNDLTVKRRTAGDGLLRQTNLKIRAQREQRAGQAAGKNQLDKALIFLNRDAGITTKRLNITLDQVNADLGDEFTVRVNPTTRAVEVFRLDGTVVTASERSEDRKMGRRVGAGIAQLNGLLAKQAKQDAQRDSLRIQRQGTPPEGLSVEEWEGLVREFRDQRGMTDIEAIFAIQQAADQARRIQNQLE